MSVLEQQMWKSDLPATEELAVFCQVQTILLSEEYSRVQLADNVGLERDADGSGARRSWSAAVIGALGGGGGGAALVCCGDCVVSGRNSAAGDELPGRQRPGDTLPVPAAAPQHAVEAERSAAGGSAAFLGPPTSAHAGSEYSRAK